MKRIILKDKTEYVIAPASSVQVIMISIPTVGDLPPIWAKIKNNISDFVIVDGEEETRYQGYTLASVSVPVSNDLYALFYTSAPLTTREQQLQQQIDALTEANEALAERNTDLEDGALAYEILTGGAE